MVAADPFQAMLNDPRMGPFLRMLLMQQTMGGSNQQQQQQQGWSPVPGGQFHMPQMDPMLMMMLMMRKQQQPGSQGTAPWSPDAAQPQPGYNIPAPSTGAFGIPDPTSVAATTGGFAGW